MPRPGPRLRQDERLSSGRSNEEQDALLLSFEAIT
jgi:hypothetical protein